MCIRDRPHRTQADRRHVRRLRPSRRRRLLRQRSHEGGSLRRLCGALRGEEYCGGRPCPQVRGVACLDVYKRQESVTQLRRRGREMIVRLLCLDASRFLDASMAKGRAAVLLSLIHIWELKYYDYYLEAYTAVLGGMVGEYQIQEPSEEGLSLIHICSAAGSVSFRRKLAYVRKLTLPAIGRSP